MIFNNMEFHNVEELEVVPGLGGYKLQRFPSQLRHSLGHKDHERGRFYAQKSVGCEIRFVTAAKFIWISLSALEQDGRVLVYKGEFLHSTHLLKAGVITTLHLEEPPHFNNIDPEYLQGDSFSPQVWRFQFGKECNIVFHHLDTFGHDVNPPHENEKPSRRWLAYGSSITFGGDTCTYNNAYVQQTANRMKVDVYNKGIAGSCFCEKQIAHYISSHSQWDFVTLELGINMRGRFTVEEYENRVRYLLQTIVEENPDKPVVAIGIYPNGADYSLQIDDPMTKANQDFIEISKRVGADIGHKNLHFVYGDKVLTDFSGLSTDLVHPSDYGHSIMAENLSKILQQILEREA